MPALQGGWHLFGDVPGCFAIESLTKFHQHCDSCCWHNPVFLSNPSSSEMPLARSISSESRIFSARLTILHSLGYIPETAFRGQKLIWRRGELQQCAECRGPDTLNPERIYLFHKPQQPRKPTIAHQRMRIAGQVIAWIAAHRVYQGLVDGSYTCMRN